MIISGVFPQSLDSHPVAATAGIVVLIASYVLLRIGPARILGQARRCSAFAPASNGSCGRGISYLLTLVGTEFRLTRYRQRHVLGIDSVICKFPQEAVGRESATAALISYKILEDFLGNPLVAGRLTQPLREHLFPVETPFLLTESDILCWLGSLHSEVPVSFSVNDFGEPSLQLTEK